MSDDEGREMLSVRVPAELKALVDADKRTNQEVAETALWREFGGERKMPLQRRIEEKENRLTLAKNERNEREREIEEIQNDIEALKAKLETVEEAKHENHEEQLRKLRQVPDDPEHPLVKEVADELGMTPEDAITEANNL